MSVRVRDLRVSKAVSTANSISRHSSLTSFKLSVSIDWRSFWGVHMRWRFGSGICGDRDVDSQDWGLLRRWIRMEFRQGWRSRKVKIGLSWSVEVQPLLLKESVQRRRWGKVQDSNSECAFPTRWRSTDRLSILSSTLQQFRSNERYLCLSYLSVRNSHLIGIQDSHA
jgi:hypothetical protein